MFIGVYKFLCELKTRLTVLRVNMASDVVENGRLLVVPFYLRQLQEGV